MIRNTLAPATIFLQNQFIRSIGLIFAAHVVLPFADRADQSNHHSLSFSHELSIHEFLENCHGRFQFLALNYFSVGV